MSNDTTEPTSNEEGSLDPRDAAALFAEVKNKASRELEFNSLLLTVLGGFIMPIVFGAIWLSVRHQHPYQGPSAGAIGVLYLVVLFVDVVALIAYRRSSRGVGGRFKRNQRVLSAIGVTGLVSVYVIMGALEHAGVSNAVVYGIYPATVPLVIGGMIGAVGAASRDDWTLFGAALAVTLVAAGAAFGGPVNAWAITGFGCGAVFFACAGVKLALRHAR
jgi:hypothetical protein